MKSVFVQSSGAIGRLRGRRWSLRRDVLVFTTTLLMSFGIAHAQGAGPASPGPSDGPPGGLPAGPQVTAAPKAAAKKIQAFTGAWQTTRMIVGLTKPGVAPLKPEYNTKLEGLVKLAVAGDEVPGNEPRCIPNGPVMDMSFGFRIFADETQMAIITSGPRIRYIWLDGRKHTSDDYLFETYGGESIAHWQGDELVVDTVGLKATDEIVFGIASEGTKMHLVERWKITTDGLLEIQTTVEDPVALTKPWTFKRTYRRGALGNDVTYCVPATDRGRNGGFDLTPPEGGYVPAGAGE
jgi:hypothetical protein